VLIVAVASVIGPTSKIKVAVKKRIQVKRWVNRRDDVGLGQGPEPSPKGEGEKKGRRAHKPENCISMFGHCSGS